MIRGWEMTRQCVPKWSLVEVMDSGVHKRVEQLQSAVMEMEGLIAWSDWFMLYVSVKIFHNSAQSIQAFYVNPKF